MERSVVRLPVTWHRQGADVTVQTAKAMQVVASLLRSIDEIFDFALVVRAGDARTEAWFEVESFDEQRTMQLTDDIAVLISTHSPWLGLGRPESTTPRDIGPYRFEIVPGAGVVIDAVHSWSPAWNAAAALDGETTLRIELLDVTSDDDARRAALRISVTGNSGSAALVAQSFAQELSVERVLRARPQSGDVPSTLAASMVECGRALATPSRITEHAAWTESRTDDFTAVVERLLATPAAIAIFGNSGYGKTTLMENLAASAMEHETIVVICAHGDLPYRLAPTADRLGVPFDALWFGDPESPPGFNLLQTPHPSIRLDEWLTLVPDIVLAAHRVKGLTYEMAGPSWHYGFSASAETIASSGAGTILDTASLLSEQDLSPALERALAQVTDPDLRRRITQARHAILKNSDGSHAVYQNSKLEFLRAPAVRRVVGQVKSTVDFRGVFEEGRHLFISASTAELGDQGASVLITAVLTAIYEIARRRPVGERSRIRLMIPEAHLVDPDLLRRLLAEGRKYGIVGTVLDLQTPNTLRGDLLTSLLGNTGAIASFRLGPADAASVDGRYPRITTRQLQQLPPFRAAVTFGDEDTLVNTAPPLSSPDETEVFTAAHREVQAARAQDVGSRAHDPEQSGPNGAPRSTLEDDLDDLFGPLPPVRVTPQPRED